MQRAQADAAAQRVATVLKSIDEAVETTPSLDSTATP
jgi:hypothetical protein